MGFITRKALLWIRDFPLRAKMLWFFFYSMSLHYDLTRKHTAVKHKRKKDHKKKKEKGKKQHRTSNQKSLLPPEKKKEREKRKQFAGVNCYLQKTHW